jgi:hypothetical protein
MKVKLALLALASVLSLSSAPVGHAAGVVVDSYAKDGYQYTCIMQDKIKYCGNWNVASGG